MIIDSWINDSWLNSQVVQYQIISPCQGQKYECETCKTKFSKETNLMKHMKKVHKIYKHLMEVQDRGIPTIATQESAIERYPDYLNQRKDTPVTMEIIQE